MGEVYSAEDTRLNRPVALKLLPVRFTTDADRVRRFEQEALAASALNHPNIVTVYDVGETQEGRFIAMEMIRGQTLRKLAEIRCLSISSLLLSNRPPKNWPLNTPPGSHTATSNRKTLWCAMTVT
jgi:serine/threonine protein kinase